MVCSKNLGSNIKVSNLAQMLAQAKYETILVNDSDIRVQPDYLRRVMAPLSDPQVGLVTCLYRGVAGPTLGSRLESLGISTDFSAGVLAARQLEGGIRFGLGSTLAFRRRDLEAIGGFEALWTIWRTTIEIGKRIAERGFESEAVRCGGRNFSSGLHVAPVCGPPIALGSNGSRFAPLGISGAGADFRFALGGVGADSHVTAPSGRGLAGRRYGLRVAVALVVGWSVLRDRQVWSLLLLLPLRDLRRRWWFGLRAWSGTRWSGAAKLSS